MAVNMKDFIEIKGGLIELVKRTIKVIGIALRGSN
jgi:hypothetical protein